jgi:hypothetical protein
LGQRALKKGLQLHFQGAWARDLAYTIGTHPTVENRRKWEEEGLEYYLEQLEKHGGPKMEKDEAWFEIDVAQFTTYAYWSSTLTRTFSLVAQCIANLAV